MTTGYILIASTFWFFGVVTGMILEDKNLKTWYIKELDRIEERYKRKYKDGDSNDQP